MQRHPESPVGVGPLAALLLLLTPLRALGQEPASTAEPPEPGPAAIELIEGLRSLRRPYHPPLPGLVDRLVGSASGQVDLLFSVLELRLVPALDEGEAQALSEVQEELILSLFEAIPDDGVRARASRVQPTSALAARRAALLGLGRVARPDGLGRLFALARGTAPTAEPGLRDALRRAVGRLLRREPEETLDRLDVLRRDLELDDLRPALHALGDVRDPRGLELVLALLREESELELEVLAQVQLIGSSLDVALNEELVAELALRLDPARPSACRSAALALAELGDFGAVPDLIDLLDADEEGIRSTAVAALRRLTGMRLHPDVASWTRWHAAELEWHRTEKRRAFMKLRSAEPAAVAEGLRLVLSHRSVQGELAPLLVERLSSRDGTIRVLAARTLADLDYRAAAPMLLRALDDPRPVVSCAVVEALQQLVGEDYIEAAERLASSDSSELALARD